MTVDLATLALRVDSSQVAGATRDLDKMTAAGARNEQATDRMGREWVRASSAAGKLRLEEAAATMQADRMARSHERAGRAASEMARDAQAAAARTTRMGTSSRLASHHVQNLSFQLQDIAVSLASGQRPMTVFMQQGSQIGGIMQQAGVGVGGLAKELAIMIGRMGPYIAVMAAAGAAFAVFRDEVNKGVDADDLTRGLGLTASEIERLQDVTVTYGDVAGGVFDVISTKLRGEVSDALGYFGLTASDVFDMVSQVAKNAINLIINSWMMAPRLIIDSFSAMPAAIGDAFYSAVNLAIDAINSLVAGAAAGINQVIALANMIPGVDISGVSAPSLGRVGNPYAGGMAGLGRAVSGALTTRDYVGEIAGQVREASVARARGRLAGQASEIIGERNNAAGAAGSHAKATDAEAKALDRATKAAQDFLDALQEETARIGRTAIELKNMEVAAAAAAAPTKELRDAIIEAGREWEKAYRAQADADFQKNIIQPLEDEIALLGLVGPARELASLALEEEAFKAQMAAQGVTDLNKAWEEYSSARKTIINYEAEQDQIRDLAGLYEDLFNGGTGNIWDSFKRQGIAIISQIAAQWTLGLLSGRPMGSAGGIAGGVLSGSPLGSIFGGLFGANDNTLSQAGVTGGGFGAGIPTFGAGPTDILGGGAPSLLQSAGIVLGSAALGNSISGNGTTASKIGSSIGSAAGYAVGGPIGSLVGSVLGGLVGGVFGSTKRGSAIVGDTGGSLGVTGFYGNSSSRKDAASGLAGSLIDGLGQIAEALGAELDASVGKVSIGVRKDSINVDPLGRGYTKTSKGAVAFGQDEQAAIEFAIRDLIKDGVLKGISAASQKILQSGQDLEKAIEKAILIESVPKLLKQRLDPLGAALDEIDAKFKTLADALREGGATAEQFAQAEQLYNLERKDAIEQFGQASQTLKDFLKSLTVGSNSPLSLRSQFATASADLAEYERKILAGETIDQAAFTQAAQLFLDLSRGVNGSSGAFFSDFDRVRALTEQAIGNVEANITNPAAPDIFSQQTASNTADIANLVQDTNALLKAINDNLQTGGEVTGKWALLNRSFAG